MCICQRRRRDDLKIYFLIVFLLTDILSRFSREWFGLNGNLYLFSWSAFAEYCFFGLLYTRHFITKNITQLKWLFPFLGVLLLVNLGRISVAFELNHFQVYDRLFVDGLILILTLCHIYIIIDSKVKVTKDEQFFNIILLLYVTVDLFMSSTINFMVNAELSLVLSFWFIRLIFMILLHIQLVSEIWKNGMKQKHKRFG